MFSRIRNFLDRHRRKFATAGIIIGSSVFLLKLIQYKLRELQERQAKEIADKLKRMQHFESTERTCNQTIAGLCPALIEKSLKDLSTDGILEKLRTSPQNKLELWDELKVIAFTRIVTLVYASSMLTVTLKTQINILGGYLYKDTLETAEKRITMNVQTAYLSMIQYFMGNDGLGKLIEMIKRNVEIVMQRYSLKQQLTLADTESIFWSIQTALNSESISPTKYIHQYTLPQEVLGDEVINRMYEETLDVLESMEVMDACLSNVSNGFSLVVDKIAEYYEEDTKAAHQSAAENITGATKSTLNVELSNINSVKITLAKLIPIVNGLTAKTVLSSSSNGRSLDASSIDMMSLLGARFMQSDKLRVLGANIYETFCQ